MNTQTPVVVFDNSLWGTNFPLFANVGVTLGQSFFNRATFLCANQPSNPLNRTPGMLSDALYLLTSHIAWLNAPRDANGNPAATGQPASPIVGRINSASEGSVSVGADMGDANAGSPSQAWYMQSTWGAEYWALTAPVRTALYVAQPTFVPGAAYPGLYPMFGRFGRGCI